MRGISWLHEELSASQEGLWSIKSVSSHRSIKSVSSHYLILFPSQYLVTQHQDGDIPLYVYVTTSLRQNYLSRNIHPKINSPFYEWSYFRRTFTSVTFRNNIHALSGCRTHDPGLRKTGGSTRLNICWYNDQQTEHFYLDHYILWSGVRSSDTAINFSLPQNVHTGSGFHPVQWLSGFFPEVKWPKREADISPPSSAVVKNGWSYPPPLTWLHGMNSDNFTF